MNQVPTLYDHEELNRLKRRFEEQNRTIQYSGVGARITQSEGIGARVYRSTTQSITQASVTPLSWDTEVYDTDGLWDVAAPTRFTCQHEGYYMAGGSVLLNASAGSWRAGRMFFGINLNAGTYVGAHEHYINGSTFNIIDVTSGMFWMNKGDYITLDFYHDQVDAKTISAATAANQYYNCAWIARIA